MKPGMSAPVSSRHIRPIPESSYETARVLSGLTETPCTGGNVGDEQVEPSPRASLPDEDVASARRHDPRVVRGKPSVRDCTWVLERGGCAGRDVEDARVGIAVDGRSDDQPAVGAEPRRPDRPRMLEAPQLHAAGDIPRSNGAVVARGNGQPPVR